MERWAGVFRSLLLLSALWGLGCGLEHDGCKNYSLQFERVFSVPGEVAMLNSTLLSHSVFNLSAEPYNITWYRLGSDQPISNQSGQVLVVQESLWLMNVTLADAGRYVTVVRTSGQCFRQETKLVVDLPLSQCQRPRSVGQKLTKGVNGRLSCPLKDYISKLRHYGISHNITWYKGCEWISDGAGRFSYRDTFLYVEGVKPVDQGLYTCTLHFNMDGVRQNVSQAIDTEVKGSNVTKRCLAFVPCEGNPYVSEVMFWMVQDIIIKDSPDERVYRTRKRKKWQDGGVSIDQWLVISELKEQDLKLNYTCMVLSGHGSLSSYFTLLRKEPELLLPVGLVLGSCLLLFLLCVSVYHVFKLELVLWFRQTFPMLYSRSGPDGKLYDAYVAFPQSCSTGRTLEVKRFALHTLPQVLEEACGYSLFIPDRDSLPGEAVTDSVEENLKVSRRIILLYTASTFSHKYCSNNNTLLTTNKDYLITSKEHLTTNKEHLTTNKEHLTTNKDHLITSKDHLTTSKEHLNTNKEHLTTSKEHLTTSKEHLTTSKEHLTTNKEHLITNKEHLTTNKEHLTTNKEHLITNKEHLTTNKEHLTTNKDHLITSKEHLTTNKEHLTTSKEHLNTNKDHLITSKGRLTTNKEHLTTNKEHLTTNKEHLTTNKDHLITSKEHLNTNKEHLNTSTDHVTTNKDHLITNKDHLTTNKDPLNTNKDHLNTNKEHLLSEDPDGASLSELRPLSCEDTCEDTCGHTRTQLECVAAMHRALLERSLKVILVELEELGPSDLKQLPESVRHLRQTQGAVCWWRTPWRTRCTRGTGNIETALLSCVSPNCRFWKEVRYRMPVKGKRTTPPEAMALLHL